MATVAAPETTRKPLKAFYAHLYETAGVLTKVEGTIYFMDSMSGDIVEVEPAMCTFLTVLGEVGLSDTQVIMDHIRGGAAAVACGRAN